MKQGDWLSVNNGLGIPSLVFLKKDEGRGLFSAWFYNESFGLDCADWALFSLDDYPASRTLTAQEVARIPSTVKEAAK